MISCPDDLRYCRVMGRYCDCEPRCEDFEGEWNWNKDGMEQEKDAAQDVEQRFRTATASSMPKTSSSS